MAYKQSRDPRQIAAEADYRARNRKKIAAYHRLKRRGWTPEAVEAAAVVQRGLCALCGCSPKRLLPDHDHTTGRPRQLLCHACNIGLGLLKDDPDLLLRAAAYVTQHK